jgi:hypothetical protein
MTIKRIILSLTLLAIISSCSSKFSEDPLLLPPIFNELPQEKNDKNSVGQKNQNNSSKNIKKIQDIEKIKKLLLKN